MDELEFRRTLYADPNCSEPEILDAIENDANKQEFWNELKLLDKKMHSASQVEVPGDLVHKLILRQTMQSHAVSKKRNIVQLAMAASIAFVVGVTFTMWQQQSLNNLTEQAIAHVYHEGDYALNSQENISLQQVNAKLARFGGEFTESVGQIYYANFCDFEDLKSLHMVMQSEHGKVSVFVIPHTDGYNFDASFKDKKYHGQTVDFDNASLVVVGEEGTDVKKVKKELSKKMLFSA